MSPRTAGLQSGIGDDIDHVIFLLGPALGIAVRPAVIAFHPARFAVSDILAAAPDDFLPYAVGSPFIRFVITVFTEYFSSQVSQQGR